MGIESTIVYAVRATNRCTHGPVHEKNYVTSQVHLNIKSKRHPLCKKRREEKRTTEVAAPQAPAEGKQPDNRTPGYPEQLFGAKLRTPEFIVGW